MNHNRRRTRRIGLATAILVAGLAPSRPAVETTLELLDFPRDTGPGLERGRSTLETLLQRGGVTTRSRPFRCHPYRQDLAALCLLLGSIGFARAGLQRRGGLVLGVVGLGLATAALAGGLDRVQPGEEQVSLEVVVDPVGPVQRELWLGAHYDTKTEPLDHVERGVLLGFVLISCVIVFLGSWIRPRSRTTRITACVTAVAVLLLALALGTGRLVRARSHGLLDDGVAVLLLVELAGHYQNEPTRSTRLRFLFWAGEEVGAQGSAAYASTRVTDLPKSIVNLEGLGAGPDLGYAGREWTGRSLVAPPVDWVRTLVQAAPVEPRRIPFPVVTDAGPFLRHGVPAITLFNLPRGAQTIRGLHGSRDRPAAVDPRGLDLARQTLLRLVALQDAPR